MASTQIGKNVTVEVIRKGQRKTLQVTIGELKEEEEPKAVSETRPRLGMTVEELTPELANKLGLSETKGVVVVHVGDNTLAAESGIRPGDIILEVHQALVENLDQFNRMMGMYKKGDSILFLIKRGEATLYLTVKVWK